MKRDLYAEVSARITAELEAGAAPWVKPWSASPGANTPCNAVSNRPYSGCNVVLLWMARATGYRTPRFLTFKQALELGGNVRKGERGNAMFLISSGAVEVVLPNDRVRLGSGDFFGEMALLSRRRRQADVVALGYCRVLVLSGADFRHFRRDYPRARADIRRIAKERTRANEEKEAV